MSNVTFKEFSRANLVRCVNPKGFNHGLDRWPLGDWFLALIGEIGEAANIGKKLNRIRDGIRGNRPGEDEATLRAKFKKEIGDAGVYLDLLAQSQGFFLGDAMVEVFNSKSDEIGYPEKL